MNACFSAKRSEPFGQRDRLQHRDAGAVAGRKTSGLADVADHEDASAVGHPDFLAALERQVQRRVGRVDQSFDGNAFDRRRRAGSRWRTGDQDLRAGVVVEALGAGQRFEQSDLAVRRKRHRLAHRAHHADRTAAIFGDGHRDGGIDQHVLRDQGRGDAPLHLGGHGAGDRDRMVQHGQAQSAFRGDAHGAGQLRRAVYVDRDQIVGSQRTRGKIGAGVGRRGQPVLGEGRGGREKEDQNGFGRAGPRWNADGKIIFHTTSSGVSERSSRPATSTASGPLQQLHAQHQAQSVFSGQQRAFDPAQRTALDAHPVSRLRVRPRTEGQLRRPAPRGCRRSRAASTGVGHPPKATMRATPGVRSTPHPLARRESAEHVAGKQRRIQIFTRSDHRRRARYSGRNVSMPLAPRAPPRCAHADASP